MGRRSEWLSRYGCAIVCVALAGVVRLLLGPLLGEKFPFTTLFIAVMVAAWHGGFGPAVAASLLGAVFAAFFLIPPRGSLAIAGVDNQMGMLLYLVVSLGIAMFGGRMRAAWRRAEDIAQAALGQTKEIEAALQAQLRGEERERRLLAEASTANAKFRAFFEQGPLFAGIMSLDGIIIEPNRLSLEACGYTREQVVGKPFWECSLAASAELVEQISGVRLLATGQTYRAEMPYFVADGSQRMVDLIVLPIKDEAGRVLFLAPTGTDITDRAGRGRPSPIRHAGRKHD